MNVLSCRGPFSFLIIFCCSALLLQSATEITKDNCRNNRTFLSECSFNISFQPPLTEKLECFLTFPAKNNYSVGFSSDSFVLQRQVGQMCPMFEVEIKTQEKKPRQLFTTCGGTVKAVSTTFNNFTWGHILYDNKGLIDNSTIIKMRLWLETGKSCVDLGSKTSGVKNHRPLIIILSAVGCLVLITVCVMIVYYCHSKRIINEAPNNPLQEAAIPVCESGEVCNSEDRDLKKNQRPRSIDKLENLWRGNAKRFHQNQ